MNAALLWGVALTLILVPFISVIIDGVAGTAAKRRQIFMHQQDFEDFRILVPIWGNMKYLENVTYLSQYGARVTLCTTGNESAEFMDSFNTIAQTHGFEMFVDDSVPDDGTRSDKRATSGTTRDRLVRNALMTVTEPYVVPLDADTTTNQSISRLVGELRLQGYDIASIRLVTGNNDTLLAKLQRFEYKLAMQLRFIAPWMVSGACHVAKTVALRRIMAHHSLFFQGNDVEIGLIAGAYQLKVGHIPFEVVTNVPGTFKPWVRQRLAWAGGEFRLFIVNCRFVLWHPFFWIYGGLVAILLVPFRWLSLIHPSLALAVVAVMYLALVFYLHWRWKSGWVLLMPLYVLVLSLIFTPIGIVGYFHMALKHKNWGVIRPFRKIPV